MEQVEGIVERVVFQSDDHKFCVFKISTTHLGLVTVVYNAVAPLVAERLEISGEWIEHAKFGQQLQAKKIIRTTSSSAQSIEKFLSSGSIKGIGPVMAIRIVKHFGAKAMEIIAKTPAKLAEVNGIGKKTAMKIGEAYAEIADMQELMLFLEEQGISANYAPKLHATYGIGAIERLKNKPYSLASDISGIGFRTADRIALAMGFSLEDPSRIKAGVEYALLQISQLGHTCIPEIALLNETTKLLQVESEQVDSSLQTLFNKDKLRTENYQEQRLVYPEFLYQAEVGTANRLLKLKDKAKDIWQIDYNSTIAVWEQERGITLEKFQRVAIESAIEHGVLILTGGPGTGKTTVVRGIIAVLEQAGAQILLAAPTGRATRRLSESSGRPAKTIHRLLEYAPYEGRFQFGRNEFEPLEADVVIIDEASMLDINLAHNLLKAIPNGCRLVFVGDIDQLPAVGPGSVLQDIIRSETMPVVKLTKVFRQAEQSGIIRNAHKINQGQSVEYQGAQDFVFVNKVDDQSVAQYVVDKYCELAETFALADIQVLSPMHKNICGVQNLNRILQAKLNPPSPEKEELNIPNQILRVGDKVMQMRNNYDKEVFNGDIGEITEVSGRTVTVYFPDNVSEALVYTAAETDELQLAYAMSVHKSQGSEYKSVILAFSRSHYIMLQRNLLYTAITRAKEEVFIVGQKSAIEIAIKNDRTRQRYSLLAERLSGLL